MALKNGDRIRVVRGTNKGKRGVFLYYSGVVSCYVILDGKEEKQMLRRGSVEREIVVENRTPGSTVGGTDNVDTTDLIREARALHTALGNVLDQLEKLQL